MSEVHACEFCGELMAPQRQMFLYGKPVENPHPKRFCSPRHRALAFLHKRQEQDEISEAQIEQRFAAAKARIRQGLFA